MWTGSTEWCEKHLWNVVWNGWDKSASSHTNFQGYCAEFEAIYPFHKTLLYPWDHFNGLFHDICIEKLSCSKHNMISLFHNSINMFSIMFWIFQKNNSRATPFTVFCAIILLCSFMRFFSWSFSWKFNLLSEKVSWEIHWGNFFVIDKIQNSSIQVNCLLWAMSVIYRKLYLPDIYWIVQQCSLWVVLLSKRLEKRSGIGIK